MGRLVCDTNRAEGNGSVERSHAAQMQKAELELQTQLILAELASDAVRRRGYNDVGGQTEVANKLQAVQLDMLPQIYADVRFETPYLSLHDRQETPTWCQIACASNAITALGRRRVSQEEIAIAQKVRRDEKPFSGQMREFITEAGLSLETCDADTVLQVMDALIDVGQVVLNMRRPAYPMEHAFLISGLRVKYGEIEFLVNDPSHDGVHTMALQRMLGLLEPPFDYNKLFRSYIVSVIR